MFRMRKPTLVSLMALLLVVVGAGTALAFASQINGATISPGARLCMAPQNATSFLNVEGHATPGVRFLVLRGPNSANVNEEIWRTPVDTISDTNASFDTSTNPTAFPGWFRLCARNLNTGSAKVTLIMSGK